MRHHPTDGTIASAADIDDEQLLELAMAADVQDALGIEPRTLKEAQSLPEWPKWKEGIEEELTTLKVSGTWEIVMKPPNVNVVGSKWVFRLKRNAEGEITRHKAQLVAQGFTQQYGVDYIDTYAPVARLVSIRFLLAITNRHDWDIRHMDIRGAYLNGELTTNEVIYMQQPPRI
jgi:hypothetical protein